jgi:hypothetical protein
MTLTLDIRANDIGLKQVNVRSNLVVANFIAEIQDKFNIDGTLGLMMEETGTMDYIEHGVRDPFEEDFKRVHLHEQRTQTEYDLVWQPAIIGRKDHRNPSNNKLLAVDLEDAENPTFLDETRLKPGIKYPLAAGSVIQVGRVSLTLNIIS